MSTMTELGPSQGTLLADEKAVHDDAATEATEVALHVLKKIGKKKEKDDEDEEVVLSFGSEGYAMLTSMSFDLTENSDLAVQELLDKITTIVIEANGNLTQTDLEKIKSVGNESLLGDGNEDYKEVVTMVMKRIMQFIRWAINQGKEGIKRVADRLSRLSVKTMYVERKIDISTDNSLPTDKFVLPRSYPMLMMVNKPPANAMEVINAVNRTKYLFTTLHNDYQGFQALFKAAVATGSRADTLEMINNYLNGLISKLSARPNPLFDNRNTFNQLPGGYRLVFSEGQSFADCGATILRTPEKYEAAPAVQRPDKASLVRLVSEIKTYLRVINEVYGKVSSRLEVDFRNIVKAAEKEVKGFDSTADIRTASTTIEWFTEQQSRLYTRSMMLSCTVLNAALDYCLGAIGAKPAVGTESFDILDTSSMGYAIESLGEQMERLDAGLCELEIDARTMQSITDVKEMVDVDNDHVIQLLMQQRPSSYFNPPDGLSEYSLGDAFNGSATARYIGRRLTSIVNLTNQLSGTTDLMKGLLAEMPTGEIKPGSDADVIERNSLLDREMFEGHPLCAFLHRVDREGIYATDVIRYVTDTYEKLRQVRTTLAVQAEQMTLTVADGEMNVSLLKEFLFNAPQEPFTDSVLCGGFRLQPVAEKLGELVIHGAVMDSPPPLKPMTTIHRPSYDEYNGVNQLASLFGNELRELAKIAERLQIGTGYLRYITTSVADNLNEDGLKGGGDGWFNTALEYLAVSARQYRWMYRLTVQVAVYEHTMINALRHYNNSGGWHD
ncbi:hypothetical protein BOSOLAPHORUS_302 [Erwinia phage vB_EamM_Bosolaphorus]|uniref:Uncharacterized protein n=1 Tax=Erwinia phage vB_EamM_Bosolaphorus TaxID=2060126 RepID=A0A2H5BIG3_9CAUD|nr:hypothetical protein BOSOLAPHORUS_302 [Erwinia phage vB_EamM_Bosolaphorus]